MRCPTTVDCRRMPNNQWCRAGEQGCGADTKPFYNTTQRNKVRYRIPALVIAKAMQRIPMHCNLDLALVSPLPQQSGTAWADAAPNGRPSACASEWFSRHCPSPACVRHSTLRICTDSWQSSGCQRPRESSVLLQWSLLSCRWQWPSSRALSLPIKHATAHVAKSEHVVLGARAQRNANRGAKKSTN